MPGACLGINVGATLANGELTLTALPGRVAFQVRPLGATSDGSELSQGQTLCYLATTNGGSEKIPPCRTNRQGIAKGSLPDTSTVLCPSCAGHTPFTCREFFLHVPVRVCNDFALPPLENSGSLRRPPAPHSPDCNLPEETFDTGSRRVQPSM